MGTSTTSIRRARATDADRLSEVFDETWREAYRGIIPGVSLERMIARRGAPWWLGAAQRRRPLVVVETRAGVVGYAVYGQTRGRDLGTAGEIDELYILPEHQGLGLGRRLFHAVRNDMHDHGLHTLGVWALDGNDRAEAFYLGLGASIVGRASDSIAGAVLPKVGYRFA